MSPICVGGLGKASVVAAGVYAWRALCTNCRIPRKQIRCLVCRPYVVRASMIRFKSIWQFYMGRRVHSVVGQQGAEAAV